MVYDLRQATILALTLLYFGCSSTEAVEPVPAQTAPDAETETETVSEDFPAPPNLDPILEKIDPNCSENGCIQMVEYFGAFDTTTLNEVIPFGVNIENGYSVWQVTYATHGRSAKATITLPFERLHPEDGYHIVLNNPLTVGFASRCASGASSGAAALAAQFGAFGMVGVTVDYPGLGTEGSHPYLVADSEAMSTLDGARATLEFLAHAEIPVSNRIAFAGLSQGGHATLSAAALHADYAPELDIRAFAAAAPSNLFIEQWTPYITTDGYHLTFYALIAYAWSRHYGYDTENIFYEPRRAEIENAISTRCLFIGGSSSPASSSALLLLRPTPSVALSDPPTSASSSSLSLSVLAARCRPPAPADPAPLSASSAPTPYCPLAAIPLARLIRPSACRRCCPLARSPLRRARRRRSSSRFAAAALALPTASARSCLCRSMSWMSASCRTAIAGSILGLLAPSASLPSLSKSVSLDTRTAAFAPPLQALRSPSCVIASALSCPSPLRFLPLLLVPPPPAASSCSPRRASWLSR